MGHNYRDEIVAQARALTLTGWSTRKAHAELVRLFPNEDTPARTTLVLWRQELSEADHQELADNEVRISLRADELVEAKMADLEDNLDKVRLPELVMTAGVYRDKGFKRAELKKPPAAFGNVIINIFSDPPDEPDVVEGEVVEVQDDDSGDGRGGVLVPQ